LVLLQREREIKEKKEKKKRKKKRKKGAVRCERERERKEKKRKEKEEKGLFVVLHHCFWWCVVTFFVSRLAPLARSRLGLARSSTVPPLNDYLACFCD